jgi:hypothetical protein
MRILLYSKHWQVFLVSFALPLLLILGGLFYFSISFNISFFLYLLFLGIAIFQIIFYAWLRTVGLNLSSVLKKENKIFKISSSLPICILFIIIILGIGFPFLFKLGLPSTSSVLYTIMKFILPVQSIFAILSIYCIYFVGRALKQNETKQNVKFADFYKEFIFILLFPIGIWFLQPKINELT